MPSKNQIHVSSWKKKSQTLIGTKIAILDSWDGSLQYVRQQFMKKSIQVGQ